MTRPIKNSYFGFSFKLFLLVLLTSCSQMPVQLMPQWASTLNSIKGGLFGYPDYEITPEIVQNIPYASIRVKIGKGPAGLMILESIEGNNLTWVSADNVTISTYKGRVVGTSNLTNNLIDYYPKVESTFLEFISNEPLNLKKYRSISLSNPAVSSMQLLVITSVRDTETITILGKKRKVILIEEEINNKYIKWKVTNKFWVDLVDGFVWKSEQQIAPNVPPIVIEVTKKPA